MLNIFRNMTLGGLVLIGATLGVSCNSVPSKLGNTPISAEQTVEYLDLTPGEIPQWRKEGEITVPTIVEQKQGD